MVNDVQATFSRLRNEFIAQLPARLDVLEKLLAKAARGEHGAAGMLHHAAHSLVGAAGVHHLMEVSGAARKLERIAAAVPPDGNLDETSLFALHKALAQLAAAAEHPSHGFAPPPAVRVHVHVVLGGDDAEDQALWLRSVLGEAGYRVEVFNDLAACRDACAKGDIPAALILDTIFPGDDDAGAEFVTEIKTKRLYGMPIIFLSAQQDMAAKLAAYQAGATRYLTKPVDQDTLLRTVASSAALTPAKAYRVLVADDNPVQLAAHAHILRQAGMEVRETGNPMEVPELLEHFAAEALVLDINMPQCSGPQLAAILRDEEKHALIPVVYLASEADAARQLLALDQGGEHFLAKPVEPRHLVAAVTLHARRFRKAREQVEVLRTTLYERERQQHAFDAHAIVSITDAAANIIYVNDKFCEASGYSRQELLGENHRIVKSGLHPPEFYTEMWRTITRGVIWHGEVCNRRKDGSLYWVETSIIPFMDAGKRPYQFISIRTDITRVKEAEQRLARSQTYANIGTWDWNIETGDLFWSERIGPLFGYAEDTLETTYQNFLATVHPDDQLHVMDAINACVEQGAAYNIEHRCVWPDGTVRWLLERGDVVRDAAGKPLHMLGVVQDITERKLTELELAENRARLEESQALAKLGNWEAGMTTGELRWSEEVYRIFGLDPARFTPSVEAFMRAVHPDDVEPVRESKRRAAETGVHDAVYRIIRPDGEVRYVHELARAGTGADGQMLRLMGTIQDVTDLKQAEQSMLQAKEAAEAASRAKSEFLASMSHELRTPLNAILGFAQLFGMDPYLPDKTKEHALEIERAGQHLLSLVNDLIDLARIEAGKLELSAMPVLVKSVVGDSLALVAPIASERGIRLIDAGGEGREVMVRADYVRLQQVLINLLANAIKYNRPQGTVHLSCHTAGGAVRISITDSGLGIPAHKHSRMFSAFDRLGAERGEVEGSGIGLVITRRIVEAMGGTVGFESIEGQGSTFWVELPATEAAGQPASARAVASAPGTAATQPPSLIVLYIEDNPMNQRLMQQVFSKCPGLELRNAHTAEIGIQLARAERPALVLMDINLPGMNGFEALAVLKDDPRTANIPVVAFTSNAMKGDMEHGLKAGFADYITKPIDIPALFRTIDKLTTATENKP